ncbi:ligase-associated DNA damage response endonuclease PdeM [Chryseobacterium shandongense]|uniref:Ligase-associated DNA damage response endonuclease PdeM n=1 Tax=Chryseobacterium shandongense TaxID=1493872 RepID=A0A3G6MNZ9_9FLAO|nr:ligase-associated DNA damage response endonuclease PdeM [Chryseobacterium shandongense]AZA57462.1 ligase-associated DNA damage response endonuclease PdeM [Chryseobacterium shandongense]AZA85710.1 ligase-associated DNA damage response endonuclease PdeM [Chryseobacterium shandongense]AZA94116.1 ligase-associated DNA damage response endonuclease PdeM [Chryseobacterium shandongense]
MNVQTKKIKIRQETFTLTNQRALFWEEQKALILSDLHIGKTAHFRKNGIALANQIMKNDLERLSILIEYFKPEKFMVVGDLLHAGDNSDVDEFCVWRNQYSDLEFHLIEGNHDRISKKLESKLCLNFKSELLEINDFMLIHDFEKKHPKFQITGHIHPGFVINSAVKKIKLPCFVVTENQILLPAFSEFTGLDTKNLPKKGKFYVFTDAEIYEI